MNVSHLRESPLIVAAVYCHPTFVDRLITVHGALMRTQTQLNNNQRAKIGERALIKAVSLCRTDVVEMLLRHCADPNSIAFDADDPDLDYKERKEWG